MTPVFGTKPLFPIYPTVLLCSVFQLTPLPLLTNRQKNEGNILTWIWHVYIYTYSIYTCTSSVHTLQNTLLLDRIGSVLNHRHDCLRNAENNLQWRDSRESFERRMHWMTTSYFPLQVADPVATMPRPTTATASRVVCRNEFKWVQSASTRSGGQHEFWKTAVNSIYVWWNTFLFRSNWIPNTPTIRLSNSNPSVTRHQPLHKHAHHSFLLVEPSLLHFRTCH